MPHDFRYYPPEEQTIVLITDAVVRHAQTLIAFCERAILKTQNFYSLTFLIESPALIPYARSTCSKCQRGVRLVGEMCSRRLPGCRMLSDDIEICSRKAGLLNVCEEANAAHSKAVAALQRNMELLTQLEYEAAYRPLKNCA